MIRDASIAVCLILILLLSGCSTPYQEKDFFGGFEEIQLDDNLWRIRFKGNAFTSQDEVRDLTLLRASEIALRNGYSYIAIVSDRDFEKKGEATIGRQTYTGSATCYGATCTGVVNSYPPSKIPFTKYSSEQLVAFFDEKPDGFIALNAEISYRTIARQYGVPMKRFRKRPERKASALASTTNAANEDSPDEEAIEVDKGDSTKSPISSDNAPISSIGTTAVSVLGTAISELPLDQRKNNIRLVHKDSYLLIYGQVENNLIKAEISKQIKKAIIEHDLTTVARFYNELEVLGRVSPAQQSLDETTAEDLLSEFARLYPQLADKVSVIVSNGIVYLMGSVPRRDGQMIIDVAAFYRDDNIKRIVSVFRWVD